MICLRHDLDSRRAWEETEEQERIWSQHGDWGNWGDWPETPGQRWSTLFYLFLNLLYFSTCIKVHVRQSTYLTWDTDKINQFLAREETVTTTSVPLTTEASRPSTEPITNVTNTAQQGTRKLLSSLRNLLDVSNKVGLNLKVYMLNLLNLLKS